MAGALKSYLASPTALKRLILYWAPLLAWMTVIFALSAQTPETVERASSPVRGLPFLIEDVTVHTAEFGVLAVLVYRLLTSYRTLVSPYLGVAVLLFTIGYGATDELHQSVVPGRDPSWLDLGYDSLGALVGLLVAELAMRWRRRLSRRR